MCKTVYVYESKCTTEKTLLFLRMNRNVIITSADKGGRAVITERLTYELKMAEHLDDSVKKGVYRRLNNVSFNVIRKLCETKYELVRIEVNDVFAVDVSRNYECCSGQLTFDPFVVSKIYGGLKIHKEGYPIRPIVSAVNCMGKPLSKWLLEKLKIIATHVNKNQIRSSGELIEKVSNLRLKDSNHKLVTWDFNSMFTNIPFEKTKYVIEKYYYLIQGQTTMSCELFLKCLSFVIEDTAFFTYKDEIFLQMSGLAMGNSLSQILAEITTSYYLFEALSKFNCGEITFCYKYVDDLLAALDERYIH